MNLRRIPNADLERFDSSCGGIPEQKRGPHVRLDQRKRLLLVGQHLLCF